MTPADDYQRPILNVDIVLLTAKDGELQVVTQKRDKEPEMSRKALIGGWVHTNEDKTAEDTVDRVLRDKAGLTDVYSEQLQTFTGSNRDPRGWSASIVYIALVPYDKIESSEMLHTMHLLKASELYHADLPFDHGTIISVAITRLRGKGAYSTLPTQLLGEKFTLPALREVYAIVMGNTPDDSSFRRKMMDLEVIEETDEFEPQQRSKKPGRLYRLKRGVVTFDRKI